MACDTEVRRRVVWPNRLRQAARAALLILALAPIAARAQTPSCLPHGSGQALWNSIQKNCIDDPQASSDRCDTSVAGVVIVPDAFKPKAQLVVARDPAVTGIESDVIREKLEPNYWAAGWAARGRVGYRLDPSEQWQVGLAINSACRRSQDRLHIHIDRLCPDVIAQLGGWDGKADHFPVGPLKPYHVLDLGLTADRLAATNVFRAVETAVAAAPITTPPPNSAVTRGVAGETIALIADKNAPNRIDVFYSSEADGANGAEELFRYSTRCVAKYKVPE